jgi:hypothetical protein
MPRSTLVFPTIAMALLLACGLRAQTIEPPPPVGTTVVLCQPNDPFRPLAEEISAAESIALLDSLEAAIAQRPTFLLWVVSPARLSDRVATTFSAALDQQRPRISTGLITGSTLEKARALYERRMRVEGAPASAIVGADTFNAPQIVEAGVAGERSRPLGAVADVLELLARGGYVHYSGHGTTTSWRPLPDARVRADAIGQLPPVVVSTTSCQTARIWMPDSIALKIVDQGAAAYSGFYFSPLSGSQIGGDRGPFRYTWPDAPIGHVVQVINEGTLRGYAGVAFQLLLGDPRIALQARPPCQFTDSGDVGRARTVSCREAPAGFIPVRVAQGARYTFVEVAGGPAVSDDDAFFNRRVQMTTIGADRFLLVEHGGGDLTIVLRPAPPIGWRSRDLVVDALDNLLVAMADRRHAGDLMGMALAGLAAAVAGARMRRRRAVGPLLPAAVIGAAAGGLHAGYGFLRQGALLTTSKSIVFSPLAAVATGVLVACGALFYLTATSWRGRVAGVFTATLVGWIGAAILFVQRVGVSLAAAYYADVDALIYRPEWHGFVVSALGCALWAVVFRAVAAVLTARRLTMTGTGTRA